MPKVSTFAQLGILFPLYEEAERIIAHAYGSVILGRLRHECTRGYIRPASS
jgi:hypothetical protein